MKSSSSSSSSSGIGFVGALTIAFIVLKLLHKIGWTWIWVLSPLWISLSLAVVVIFIGLGVYLLVKKVQRSRRARNNKVNKE